jgi:hypothetical protein
VEFDSQQRKEIFLFPYRQDILWGSNSFLFNGCFGLFPWGGGGVKQPGLNLTTHLHLVLKFKMSGVIILEPTGKTLTLYVSMISREM